jgi:hypothetical protein
MVPTAPAGVTYTDVCSGSNYGCALRSNGGVDCWGEIASTPPLTNGVVHESIFCRDSSMCAVLSDGTIRCWTSATNYGPAPDNW